jgi:hypothetical protein
MKGNNEQTRTKAHEVDFRTRKECHSEYETAYLFEACFDTGKAHKNSLSPEQNWFHETTLNGLVGAHIFPRVSLRLWKQRDQTGRQTERGYRQEGVYSISLLSEHCPSAAMISIIVHIKSP